MRSWLARFLNETRSFLQGNLDLWDPQVEGWVRTRQPRASRQDMELGAWGQHIFSKTSSHKVLIQRFTSGQSIARQAPEGGGVAAERK